MNYQEKIKHIQTHFPMSVLLKKLKILPFNFNINHRFPCPIHQGKNPTCCHFTSTNKIHCWKCGKDFDIIDVYIAIRQIKSFHEVIYRIAGFMNSREFKTLSQQEKIITKTTINPFQQPYLPMKPKQPIDEQKINIKKKQLFKEISPLFNQIRDYYHYLLTSNRNNESQPGLTYLTQKRKLTLETIKEFKLGYAPLSNKPLSFSLINYCKKKNINIDKLVEYGFIKKKPVNNVKNIFMILFMVPSLSPLKMVIIKLFIFIKTISVKFLTFNLNTKL
ncbi:DNA primase [Columbia Basin potato purple top phytoplasma]|uniref:DNA primase n=1 Tax=Columbia Basin potato purple top phytoplasma TaxID=307134 RepID=A0ABT5LB12_9MOLU|nr:DNA primase [Columbia Basin potato purple top phytoplasma]